MTAPIPFAAPDTGIAAETLVPLLHAAQGRIDLQVLPECDSSNAYLLAAARAGAPVGTAVLTQRQTAGRGRRGRSWYQSEEALAFSLLWQLPLAQASRGLSLAVGLAIAESIGPEAQLKWPNDVLIDGRKVAGILIESAGSERYVIGIGVNLGEVNSLPDEVRGNAGTVKADRLALLAATLDKLVETLDVFAAQGFLPLRGAWLARHAYQDQAVNLFMNDGGPPVQGVCRGVDADGALLLETATCIQSINSGEVSLRLQ